MDWLTGVVVLVQVCNGLAGRCSCVGAGVYMLWWGWRCLCIFGYVSSTVSVVEFYKKIYCHYLYWTHRWEFCGHATRRPARFWRRQQRSLNFFTHPHLQLQPHLLLPPLHPRQHLLRATAGTQFGIKKDSEYPDCCESVVPSGGWSSEEKQKRHNYQIVSRHWVGSQNYCSAGKSSCLYHFNSYAWTSNISLMNPEYDLLDTLPFIFIESSFLTNSNYMYRHWF